MSDAGAVSSITANTPSVALRHYVDPTEAAFDRALTWRPEKSGAKSGALEAQKATQQVDADNGEESQDSAQVEERQAALRNPATHSDTVYIRSRECMGIEPTDGFLQAAHWF